MYPTIPYTGRHRIHLHYVRQNGHVCAARRAFPAIPHILCVFLLALFTVISLNHPAYAVDLTEADDATSADAAVYADTVSDPEPQPTAPKVLDLSATSAAPTNLSPAPLAQSNPDATYVYIDCPVMGYKGTIYKNEPIEYLVDDFEDIPERWLHVLTPLEAGENYFFTLDLACRTLNAPFEGQITAIYNSYVPDDGSLGTVTIEATEQINQNTFLVYRGELKYISDGTVNLVPTNYGSIYDCHLFYFSLATTDPDFPEGTEPLGEQRLSRISGPAISAEVAIIGTARCTENVYDNDLLQSDYMYPYRKYEPAEGSQPTDTLSDVSQPNDTLFETIAAPGTKPVEPATLPEPIFFLARYLAPPDLVRLAAV